MQPFAIAACIALTACLQGCLYGGAIYQDTTTPFDVNLNNTDVHKEHETGETKRLIIPLAFIALTWDSNAIGDIAKKSGMQRVFYADKRVLNILGIWRQEFVTIYGK